LRLLSIVRVLLANARRRGQVVFVKEHIRKGLLPRILEQVLKARGAAKGDMNKAKAAGDYSLAQIMDGRQLALKLTANAVYGFTSAHKLSYTFIAERVCQFGRFLITFTTETIHARFNTRTPDVYRCLRAGIDPNWDGGVSTESSAAAPLMIQEEEAPKQYYSIFSSSKRKVNSDAVAAPATASRDKRIFYEADADVIYGDTDSVMINFGKISIPRSQELGREASAYLKPFYKAPNNCIWEKSLLPFLLEDKKRYAGGYWTRPDVMDRIDCKGIETQRRDWTGICSDVLNACMDELMIKESPQGAVDVVHKACADLLLGRVDISKLILTKGILAHTPRSGVCAKKERERERER